MPNSTTGVISTCYSQATGTWRPIDKQAGQTCKGGKTLSAVTWPVEIG